MARSAERTEEGDRSSRARDAAVGVLRTLRENGHTAYFAGGCVRDELLGLLPQDYDIATDARPERVRALFKRTDFVGASFGVVLVKTEGFIVEVATFRSDGPYSDKRRPDYVEFSNAQGDAMRRDFTVNALFLDPTEAIGAEGIRGEVIDYVNGLADLRAGVIRAVGLAGARLNEDHLRALRAVRFAARLGFEVEAETAKAVAGDAANLAGVSRERVGVEVRKMLAHPTRGRAVDLLTSLGLLRAVFGVEQSGDSGDPLSRVAGDAQTALAAVALLPGAGDDDESRIAVIRDSLCLSNEESDALTRCSAVLRLLPRWDRLSVAKQKRLAASGGYEPAMAITEVREFALADHIRRGVVELSRTPSGIKPVPILTGSDLIASGLRPGPEFRFLLESVYDAQLEGRVVNMESAMELVRSLRVRE